MGKQDKKADRLRTIAAAIAVHGRRVGEIHRLLDNYAINGSQPVNEKAAMYFSVDEMSRGDLARTLINLPPTISKARKKLSTLPPDSDDAKLLQQNINTWQVILNQARAVAKQA